MTSGPVIVREMRAESRHPFTHWLRVLGALAALGAGLFMLRFKVQSNWGFGVPESYLGIYMAVSCHWLVLLTIALFVPLLTADCISREKREGTLQLLFLTPLRLPEIITGKCVVHALRAVTLVVSVIPALAICFLLGGVQAVDLLTIFILQASAVVLALAAGVLASSLSQSVIAVYWMAEVFSLVSVGCYCLNFKLAAWFLKYAVAASILQPFQFSNTRYGYEQRSTVDSLLGFVPHGSQLGWGAFFTGPNATLQPVWAGWLAIHFVLCLGLGGFLVWLAARITDATWRGEVRLLEGRRWWKDLSAPRFFLKYFRRSVSGQLERNPVVWLHRKTAGMRLAKWGWLGTIILIEALYVPFARAYYRADPVQQFIGLALVCGLAFSVAGSFRHDLESGAMEILMTTPLKEGQLIWARIRAVWGYYLPAFVAYYLIKTFVQFRAPDLQEAFSLIMTFICTPWVGLFCAFRLRSFLAAWLATMTFSVALPSILFETFAHGFMLRGFYVTDDDVHWIVSPQFWQFIFAVWFGRLLYRRLKQRKFYHG
jgi:ABC-type transport system involved in cytochrome c biogenesis permease component